MSIPAISPLTIKHQRLSEQIFERLADAIVHGDIAQGADIRDTELADQLGVSRMPVREALQRLERAGLIESAPSRYTRVVVITPRLAADAVEYSAHWYGAAAHMSVQKMDDTQRSRAFDLLDAVLAEERDHESFHTAIRVLLAFLIECTANQIYMEHGLDTLYLVELATRDLSHDGMSGSTRCGHIALREAIERRDPYAAARAVHTAHGLALDI